MHKWVQKVKKNSILKNSGGDLFKYWLLIDHFSGVAEIHQSKINFYKNHCKRSFYLTVKMLVAKSLQKQLVLKIYIKTYIGGLCGLYMTWNSTFWWKK